MTGQIAGAVDFTSVESIIHGLYASISGLAGVPRDWDTFRSAFHPEARLMPTRPTEEGGSVVEVLRPDDYVASRSAHFGSSSFFEVEFARREHRFGNTVTVFSAYESKESADGPPMSRGLNSFQMWWDGRRWWVMSVLWDNERDGVSVDDFLEG